MRAGGARAEIGDSELKKSRAANYFRPELSVTGEDGMYKYLITIAIGLLGGSVVGLYTNYVGGIIGAALGALIFTYVEYRSNQKEANKKRRQPSSNPE